MEFVHKMMAKNSKDFAEPAVTSKAASSMEVDEKFTAVVMRW